ncbi:MAG: endolytic transglycosylase MltG [bacterium]|nr:endolytic transglycosylase MltG [bacterium]
MTIFRFFARRFLTIGSLIIVLYGVYALYVWFIPHSIQHEVEVVVPPGQRGSETLAFLHDNHIISNPFLAGVYLFITGNDGHLQAGTYSFAGKVTLSSVVHTMTKPQYVPEVTLTFREGLTGAGFGEYLKEQGHPAGATFLQATQQVPKDEYPFLVDLPRTATLEGYLFPDTYRVYPDATADDIINAMLENFDIKFTQQMRDDIVAQKRTIFDVITLASIVEKEVATDEDRAIVAGIFYKRMALGMTLGSDATVNYVTGKSMAQPTFDDVASDSPYNTYKHTGLPPGPIDNPGLASIKSVIYYTKTPYLYFLTDRQGNAIYSKTYEEHLANKRKYLPSIAP